MTARWIRLAGGLAALLLSGQAVASPYCVVVQGLPDQCIYADGRECQTRANQLGGVCQANPTEVVAQTGPGRFCLVIGGRASLCIFPDRNSCAAEAVQRQTACIESAQPAQPGVDPFAIRRPY